MNLAPNKIIRIAIADDHELIRMGLVQIIKKVSDFVLVAEAKDGSDLLEKFNNQEVDVLLLDISMPKKSGWDVMEEIHRSRSEVKIIILSASSEDDYAMQFYKAGAVGYMTKDSAKTELVRAIRKVANGGKYVSPNMAEKFVSEYSKGYQHLPHEKLSTREFQIFLMIASGKSLTNIANELHLAVPTIGTYRTRILMKLSVENNSQIIKYAYQNKLIQ